MAHIIFAGILIVLIFVGCGSGGWGEGDDITLITSENNFSGDAQEITNVPQGENTEIEDNEFNENELDLDLSERALQEEFYEYLEEPI